MSPQKKMLLSNRLRRRLRRHGDRRFRDLLQAPQGAPARPPGVGRVPAGDHHARDLSVPRREPVGLVPEGLSCRSARLPPRRAKVRGRCGSGRPRAAPATRPTRSPAASPACLPNLQRGRFRFVGTDIGVGAVEQARDAVFGERAMRLVPEEYHRFFAKANDGPTWQAKPILTNLVRFRQHNLMDPLAGEAVRPGVPEERADLLRRRLEEEGDGERPGGDSARRAAGGGRGRGRGRSGQGLHADSAVAVPQARSDRPETIDEQFETGRARRVLREPVGGFPRRVRPTARRAQREPPATGRMGALVGREPRPALQRRSDERDVPLGPQPQGALGDAGADRHQPADPQDRERLRRRAQGTNSSSPATSSS